MPLLSCLGDIAESASEGVKKAARRGIEPREVLGRMLLYAALYSAEYGHLESRDAFRCLRRGCRERLLAPSEAIRGSILVVNMRASLGETLF